MTKIKTISKSTNICFKNNRDRGKRKSEKKRNKVEIEKQSSK